MKIFTNKKLIQKLIISIVMVTLLNFCISPMQVQAAGIGGLLANGLRDLALILPDAAISVVQLAITGAWMDPVERKASAEKDNTAINSEFWQTSVKYPIIQISPELIFSDQIELLSIDFMSGKNDKKEYIIPANGTGSGSEVNVGATIRTIIATWYNYILAIAAVGLLVLLMYIGINIIISSSSQKKAKYRDLIEYWAVGLVLVFTMHFIMLGTVTGINFLSTSISKALNIGKGIPLIDEYGNIKYNKRIMEETHWYGDTVNRFTGKFDYLEDVDSSRKIFTDVRSYLDGVLQEKGETNQPITIKYMTYGKDENGNNKTYGTIDPNDKNENAKFEELIKGNFSGDIVVTYQYNDSDGNTKNIVKLLFTPADGFQSINDKGNKQNSWTDVTGKLEATETGSDILEAEEINQVLRLFTTESSKLNNVDQATETETQQQEPDGKQTNIDVRNSIITAKKTTNIKNQNILVSEDAEDTGSTILYYINYARLYCNANPEHNVEGYGFTIVYILLVYLTIFFLFRYLKRVLYIAFLTIVAPLVALTYPMDKMKDGSTQTLNIWFREYSFNVLIQPIHLLCYSLVFIMANLIPSASWVFIVCGLLGMTEIEKLVSKIPLFDKSGSLSAAGSFAGGSLLSNIFGRFSGSNSGNNTNNNNNGRIPLASRQPKLANPTKPLSGLRNAASVAAGYLTGRTVGNNQTNGGASGNGSSSGVTTRTGRVRLNRRGRTRNSQLKKYTWRKFKRRNSKKAD